MIFRYIACVLSVFLLTVSVCGQIVETAAVHPKIIDGLHVDSEGNVYASPGGLQGGVTIGVFREPDQFEPALANGFGGPIDIDVVHDSLLLVTNYDNNTLGSYNLNSGAVRIVATDLDGPSGITVDDANNAYIASFGAPPGFAGRRIFKYSADGQISVFVDSPLLFHPQGITFDHHGILYIASNGGEIFRIDPLDRSPELFVDMPFDVGALVFRKKDQCIYFPSDSKIYKFDVDGNVEWVAGSSEGYTDGQAADARFQAPLGLGFSVTEDTLYVSEARGAGRLRRVIFSPASSVRQLHASDNDRLIIYPSPASDFVTVEFTSELETTAFTISVHDIFGRSMYRMTNLDVRHRIDVRDWPKGAYILKVNSAGSDYTEEFVIR